MNDAIEVLQNSSIEDIIEIRIDRIQNLNLKRLLRPPRPKIIITNRCKAEGGNFSGTALEQLEILSEAIKLGADYVDIELTRGSKFIRQLCAQSDRTKIISSYHNFRHTPQNLHSIYESLRDTGAHIVKISTMANNISDNMIMFDILKRARKKRQKIIAHCMGEQGEVSRILGGMYGNFLTYSAVSPDTSTAPGQFTIDILTTIYRVNFINSKTKIFGLVGNPVKQSRGIYYHNNIFSQAGLNAVYLNFLANDIGKFFLTYKNLITGVSVTMPFKKDIIPYLDHVDADSGWLGAVNTVVKRRGKFYGSNTDLSAIISLLKNTFPVKNKFVTVLGTGAIAKTMAFAAISHGARVTIVGRDSDKARQLANYLQCRWTTFPQLTELRTDILMNGTSIGMRANGVKKIVPMEYLKRKMTIFDAVYDPVMTPLLEDAKAIGCKIITGMELFEKQANLQSKLFWESLK